MNQTRSLIAGLALMLVPLPATAESIQLEQSGGVYILPVRVNDTVTVPFVLDSGAAEVVITEDVFLVLRRAGTISQSDFLGTGRYTVAGGATVSSDRYLLHKMVVGNHVIAGVVANVVPVKGDPLLGQSFLRKLPAWTLDNAQHALVLRDEAGSGALPSQPMDTPQCRRDLATANRLIQAIANRVRLFVSGDLTRNCQLLRQNFADMIAAREPLDRCLTGYERSKTVGQMDGSITDIRGVLASKCQ